MPKDFLTDTKTLIQLLEIEGHKELAAKLQESMDAASTSTELLMRIRHTLESNANTRLSDLARERIENLAAESDDILK